MQAPSRQPAQATPPLPGVADAAARNIIAGVRLAFARPIERTEFALGTREAITAILAVWLIVVLAARLEAGAGAEMWSWGVAAFAARFYLGLSAIGAICWLTARSHACIGVLTATLFACAPVLLFSAALTALSSVLEIEPGSAPYGLFSNAVLAWLALVFWRVCAVVADRGVRRNGAAVVLFVGSLTAINTALPQAQIFYRPDHSAGPPPLDIESIYYRQERLLRDALAGLSAQDPARIDLYYLSFGAYAAQDVFMREALNSRAIVERELGLGGRSLALVNNTQTLDELPLANPPNLARALAGIGRIIDREQDIVFVFLTSHGAEEAYIAAEFGELAPNDVHASALRAALDAAAIRWRVIVVSACYSGSFIEPLRSPQTLVITAAAADRSSFGCRHENAWTYFGRAFFAEALTRTGDLPKAFASARAAIAEREHEENKRASKPQIALGSEIAAHLRAWSWQRETLRASP